MCKANIYLHVHQKAISPPCFQSLIPTDMPVFPTYKEQLRPKIHTWKMCFSFFFPYNILSQSWPWRLEAVPCSAFVFHCTAVSVSCHPLYSHFFLIDIEVGLLLPGSRLRDPHKGHSPFKAYPLQRSLSFSQEE